MWDPIKLAYHHSKLFKLRDALGNWVKGSQIAARIALPPGRVDPFAGSFIIKRLSRYRDKMKPRRKVSQKNRPWRRHIAAVKCDFINAPGRLFCLFVFGNQFSLLPFKGFTVGMAEIHIIVFLSEYRGYQQSEN